MAYSRALIKLSGEALMGEKPYGIDPEIVQSIAKDVSIQASDKTEFITTKQKKALPPETVPVEYVSPTQPAKGIRLAAPTKKLGDYEFSAQKQIGVKSSATGLPERTEEREIGRAHV